MDRRAPAALGLLLAASCARAVPSGPCEPADASAKPAVTSAAAPASASASAKVDIVQAGTPALRTRAVEVAPERIATPEFQALVARMIDTMRRAPGVGLAAPQLGVSSRVIVLEDRLELMARLTPAEVAERGRVAFGPRVFVNPVLRMVGDEQGSFFEGCLSVRGYVGLVARHLEVEVTGLDEHGTATSWRVRGWPARILQHEVDHLDGTLYIDRMVTRSFTTADLAKPLYAGKSSAEILRQLGLGN